MARYRSVECQKRHWKTHKVSCSHLDQFAKGRHRIQAATADVVSKNKTGEGITADNKDYVDYIFIKTTKNSKMRELYKKWEYAEVEYGIESEQFKEAERVFLETQEALVEELTEKYNAKVLRKNAEMLLSLDFLSLDFLSLDFLSLDLEEAEEDDSPAARGPPRQ